MDDELIGAQILRKIVAGRDIHFQIRDPPAQQCRNFHPADILCIRYVRTGFRNQDPGIPRQVFHCFCTRYEHGDIALCGSQQDGEGRQRTGFGNEAFHLFEDLGIGDNQIGLVLQTLQRLREGFQGTTDRDTASVQQFPQDLHLRQDEPAFRRLTVLGHHQHHDASFVHQAAREECFIFFGKNRNKTAEDRFRSSLGMAFLLSGMPRSHLYHGNIGFLQEGQPFFIERMAGYQQDRDIRAVNDRAGKSFPPGAQFPRIAISGRIDQYARTDTRQFHPFADGIGRRPRQFAHQGHRLSGNRIHQRGFPGIGGAEKRNLNRVQGERI